MARHIPLPKIKRSEIVLACIIISGCASVSVPKGWLEEPADVQASEFGGWVTVYSSQVTGDDYEGELLAIDDDQLVLLSQSLVRRQVHGSIKRW